MSPRSSKASGEASALEAYRKKRDPQRTPEPFGDEAFRPRSFVVQLHSARRLHFDLRLEVGGVLKSWAVPKGPSFDPQDKRLAVATEDHPVEYGEFEGLIPEGNYGAGAMIVWDRGRYKPLLDPEEGHATGKYLFELFGYKLRGVWTLVKTSRDEKEWLLIKKPDGWAGSDWPGDRSVLSGLTVDDLKEGHSRAAEVLAEIEDLGAPAADLAADQVEPMLAESGHLPFSDPDWIFELKYDGYRILVEKRDGRSRLLFRSGRDATASFPDLARAIAALPFDHVIADGEAVVLEDDGRPSFQRLQKRGLLSRAPDIERAAIEHPATLFLFDLLAFEGHDLRPLPLAERKALLSRLLPGLGPIRYADHVEEKGEALWRQAARLGLEGLVAKRAAAPYRGGRSGDWRKLPADRRGDFAVVGFTAGKGSRTTFGALHLAGRSGSRLAYVGRVGSGFSESQLDELDARLRKRLRPTPPCEAPTADGELPEGAEHSWVDPELVCEVRFKSRTEDGLLRQPVFLGLRPDKTIAEVDGARSASEEEPEPPPGGDVRRAQLTNLEKVFWPDEGYTKGDLLDYYRAVAPSLLPYLRDRPLVLDRYPDGIAGKSFFQKNAPDYVPGWVQTARAPSDDGEPTHSFVCNDLESLLYVVNLGAIPLHVGSARIGDLESPDWCSLDLDPKGAPFSQVVTIAREVAKLCRAIGAPCFPKTSGGTGLHLLIPLGTDSTHEQARLLGELLARLVVGRLPEIATIARSLAERGGKVYVDFLQNGRGKLLVAPFSVRPRPGAPASAPLRWREVNARLDPGRFTIKTLPRRMKRLGEDPMAPLLASTLDLRSVLAGVEELFLEEAGGD